MSEQETRGSALGADDVVLVTGAAGLIGAVVVPHLADAGLRVVAVDRSPFASPKAELVLVGDVRDSAFVEESLRPFGRPVDAVVHLAAIPSPGQVPEDETLTQNVQGAYLVLDGAGRAGVRCAVAASSVSAYGYAWAGRDLSPPYAPIDEDQAPVTIDSYGLSKMVTEQVGAFATRRWGMPTTLLRFPFVGDGDRLAAQLAQIRRNVAGSRRELWAWLDTRDAAGAVHAVLTSGLTGHHVVNIAAPDTSTTVPTAELLARFHPSTQVRAPLRGVESLVDSSAARRLFGFETRHGWRDEATTP
ncbi:NAD-dependent epimerase/dehydratase family protein [Plantactinospora soyae]|uniref:Nucleoside-diphosphate-sugar epimerase n=1 Tax=Plantactinospora soyae TaxID=1544732 RepID=A0A927MBT8_9ACTN|nr:NAD(P)-dependent oxidoreductase [Plantactinospora soyae]MBE1491692.1 nucleoside-diphosphate-sugar epimerase [Plantactinospora soyae]